MLDESQQVPGEEPLADATSPPDAGHVTSPESVVSASTAPRDVAPTEEHAAPTEPEAAAEAPPTASTPPAPEPVPEQQTDEQPENSGIQKDWYILKVQSNREDSISDGLQRRVAIAGLQDFFGEVIVPTEMVTEFKNGKKRVVKRKLYPGYIVVHMALNDDTWFLVRDTPGIGDFTGAGGRPIPMQPHEVSKLIAKQEEKTEEQPRLKINFKIGDRVKINEGTFENFEGEVHNIDETNGRVTVMINIFGRSTPVELEYWQVESM